MRNDVRDDLATLGQFIVVAEHELELAIAGVQEVLLTHGDDLDLVMVSELTTLSTSTLEALVRRG